MPYIPNYEVKQFATGGTTWSVDLTVLSQEYYIYGSGTMTGNSSMAGTGTPLDGMVLNVYYSGNFVLNGSTITIFGQSLTQQQAQTNCYIKVRYDGTAAAWVVLIFADDSELPQGNDGVNTFALTNAGATETLVAGIDKRYQHITGSGITLLGSWVWTAGGTPIEGDEFMVHFNAANTILNGNNVTIFGKSLTALQALHGDCFVYAIYNGSTWDSILLKAPNVDDFRVLGSSGDTSPAYLDSKVKNSIEIDGNQLQLVNDSASPGALTIYGTNSSGVKGWYPYATGTILSNTVTLSDADILTLNTVPIEVIPNPGVGLAVDVLDMVFTISGTGGVVTPYATHTQLDVLTDTATKPQRSNTKILVSTVDRIDNELATSILTLTTDTRLISNKSVYITVPFGDPTAGDAGNVLKINIFYRVISI